MKRKLQACGGAVLAAMLALPSLASAQSETLFQPIGADTALSFENLSLPGATGIDFRFVGGFAPSYPEGVSHLVAVVFEWGASAAGPWAASPDHVKTVPGGTTTVFDTGLYRAPADAAWVQIHFYAGDLMTVSGTFSHISVVPEPLTTSLWAAGLAVLAWRRQFACRTGAAAGGI